MSTISSLTPHDTAREVIDESLLAGEEFFRWREGETTYAPVHLSVDPQGYYLLEDPRGQAMLVERKRRAHDLLLVSDLSPGRVRRCKGMQALLEPQGLELQGEKEDCFMCLVERTQNLDNNVHYIVNPSYTYYAHPDPAVIAHWSQCVNRLCYSTAQLNMDLFHQLNKIMTQLKWENVNEGGPVEVKKFLKLFNLHRDKRRQVSEVLQQMQLVQDEQASLIKADSITLDTLWEFYSRFAARQDIETLFYTKSSNRPFLEVKKFVKFLNEDQRDPRKNVQLYPKITQRLTLQMTRRYEDDSKLGDAEGEKKLTFDGFHKLLLSEHTSVIDRNHLARCDDLSLPLSSYFINSSHNSYLTGNQLTSHSSVEMYIQALLLGCRCVELDCWDGNTEPVITHGNTLCSKISFEDVVRAIADFAFVKSDLPVVLSFENHCSPPYQQLMARYCVKYFGEKLLDHPLTEYPLDPGSPLPPPSALRHKILIKNKKAPHLAEGSEPEAAHSLEEKAEKDDEELETEHIDQHLGDLVNYVQPIKFKSFENSDKLALNFQMSSFSEVKGLEMMQVEGENFRRYNITHTSRVYPAGGRINSSNYMPQLYWNVGCHMVALNYQTADLSMQLNQAKFEYNGNCGYLCKPDLLRSTDLAFDPFSLKQPGNRVPTELSLKIISAQFLGAGTRDVQVQCEVFGLPADTCRGQKHKNKWTKFVPYNGVMAYFEIEKDKTILFPPILCEELALLRLTIVDDSGNFIAQRTLPINSLQTGYRHVFLRDRCNHTIPLASLFMHIQLDDYVTPQMENFVKMLANPENMKQQVGNLEAPDEAAFRKEALDALLLGTELESEEGRSSGGEEDDLATSAPTINKINKAADPSISSSTPCIPKQEGLLEVAGNRVTSERSISPSSNLEHFPPIRSTSESISRRPTYHGQGGGNGLFPKQASQLQRHSEPDARLPVIIAACNRKGPTPCDVLRVRRESKEYSQIIKQQQKDLELKEKYFTKELDKLAQGRKTHVKRLGSIDTQIGKLDKENKKLQLSTSSRPSRLLRMQTTSEELEKLKDTKEQQEQMYLMQTAANSSRLEDSKTKEISRQQMEWDLQNKKLTQKLVSESHKRQKEQLLLKPHASDIQQLDREMENWKHRMIKLLIGQGMMMGHVTETVCKMIEGYRSDLRRIHDLELKCFEESSDEILLSLEKEIQEMAHQLEGISPEHRNSLDPIVNEPLQPNPEN